MGSESGLPFNAAIRCYKNEERLHIPTVPDVIPGMVTVSMPLPNETYMKADVHLPPQETCQKLVMRYFEEVHSLYWLYSSERFHSQLEETYRVSSQDLTTSWKCALYSILAIGSLGSPYPEELPQYIVPGEYLQHAKSFVSGVCDEGSLDSIRAMVLLVCNLVIFEE